VLDPVRDIEQQFGRGGQGMVIRMEQNGADLAADGRTTGLTGGQAVPAGSLQPLGNRSNLGRFPRPFNSFKGNEHNFLNAQGQMQMSN
jgi:hypothetical protein